MTFFTRKLGNLELGEGTDFPIESEEGLEAVTVRSGTRPLPRADGAAPGLHRVDQKRIVVRGYMVANTVSALEAKWETFQAQTEARQTLRRYQFPVDGDDRYVWARVIDRPSERNVESELVALRRWTLGLEVADPRIYSLTQFNENVPTFEASGGGADFPNEFPGAMSAATQEKAFVVHDGTSPAFPTLQFQAESALSSLLVVNETNGSQFEMGESPTGTAFAMSDGQTLVADLGAYVRSDPDVDPIRIGASSRFGHWQLPREPLSLGRGGNTLRFETDGTATAIVQWRNTYGGSFG